MSDVFRTKYKPLSDDQKALMAEVKERAKALFDSIEKVKNAGEFVADREMAIAKTHLETSVMWAVKGITK